MLSRLFEVKSLIVFVLYIVRRKAEYAMKDICNEMKGNERHIQKNWRSCIAKLSNTTIHLSSSQEIGNFLGERVLSAYTEQVTSIICVLQFVSKMAQSYASLAVTECEVCRCLCHQHVVMRYMLARMPKTSYTCWQIEVSLPGQIGVLEIGEGGNKCGGMGWMCPEWI